MLLRKTCAVFLCLTSFALCATVPRPASDFAVQMNNGTQVHANQFPGKVVVLAFILTYCAHCQFTVRILTKLQNEFGPQGFQVVASAIDPMSSMKVPDFIRQFQPTFPVGFNEHQAAVDYLQHPVMFRLMMPQLVVIDRKGIIRAQLAGDDKFFAEGEQEKNLRALLDPLLKEGVAQTAHRKRAAK
jgi:peroxiredoxin